MKKRTLLIGLILLCTEVSAQEKDVERGISLQVAHNTGYFKDSNFSPLHYQQSGLTYGLSYFRKRKNAFRVQLDFSPSKLETETSRFFTANQILGNLRIGYEISQNAANRKASWYFGPQYQFHANFVDFRGLDAFTALFAHSANITGGINYRPNERHRFQTGLALPVLSLVVRPPYNGFDEQLVANAKKPLKLVTDGQLMGPDKYLAIDYSVIYGYQVAKRLEAQLGYTFNYYRVKDTHELVFARHQINLGITFKY